MPVQRGLTRLHHSLYATACRFGRHPGLGTTRRTSRCALSLRFVSPLKARRQSREIYRRQGSWSYRCPLSSGHLSKRTCSSASLLGAVSGQVQPGCYHPNPPPTYTPKRATGVAITSQIARSRFLTLVRRPDPVAFPLLFESLLFHHGSPSIQSIFASAYSQNLCNINQASIARSTHRDERDTSCGSRALCNVLCPEWCG